MEGWTQPNPTGYGRGIEDVYNDTVRADTQFVGNGSAEFYLKAGNRYVIRAGGNFGGGSFTVATKVRPNDNYVNLQESDLSGDLTFAANGSREIVADGNFLRATIAGGTGINAFFEVVRIGLG